MGKIRKSVLAFRKRGSRGAIMKPATFKKIVAAAQRRGLSKAAATREAGKAYWQAAKDKARRGSYKDLSRKRKK